MKYFLIALQFLTIFPIKIDKEIKEKDYGKALVFFPVVGVLIGALLAVVVFISAFLPKLLMSALVVIASIIITGAIHLDGFADMCDGFYGQNTKKRILDIMRDSRIGAMGVVGIAGILLLKFSLIASLPFNVLWRALILMMVFGRFSQALSCAISNYPREEGKAKYFIEYSGTNEFTVAGIFSLAVAFFVMGVNGLIIFAVSLIPVFLFIYYSKKKIGGMTGDTIGAVNEIAEVSVLFASLLIFLK